MDFWAWDRACFAKLESWEALNQLISPPQPAAAAAAPSGKAEGQPNGLRPGEGCTGTASPPSALSGPCQRLAMTPTVSPEPGMLPSALPAQLGRKARTAHELASSTYTTTRSGSPEFRQ